MHQKEFDISGVAMVTSKLLLKRSDWVSADHRQQNILPMRHVRH